MFLFTVFSKMKLAIKERVVHHEPGLYLYIIFPITIAFLLTFGIARLISILAPFLYLSWQGIHVHHFTYGFFVLAAAGYLALVFSGPRAKYLISLLHGFGLGLAFDEFGMWIHLSDNDPVRWNYDGFIIIIGAILLIITAKPGVRFVRNHFPLIKHPKDTRAYDNTHQNGST